MWWKVNLLYKRLHRKKDFTLSSTSISYEIGNNKMSPCTTNPNQIIEQHITPQYKQLSSQSGILDGCTQQDNSPSNALIPKLIFAATVCCYESQNRPTSLGEVESVLEGIRGSFSGETAYAADSVLLCNPVFEFCGNGRRSLSFEGGRSDTWAASHLTEWHSTVITHFSWILSTGVFYLTWHFFFFDCPCYFASHKSITHDFFKIYF